MSGLEPAGVPSALAGITHAFQYNDFVGLEKIVSENSLAAIKMEVMRNYEPEDDFLQKVRELANKHDIALIFDECSSGFRETCGGLYKKFNVEPDIIVYGKTLANGYALNAVCGRRSVMDAAQKTFISSTFWTERVGPVAALEALSQMEKINSFEIVPKIGATIKQNWKRISENNNIEMLITGTDSIPVFSFQGQFKLEYKTFMTQEMLKKGYLASTAFIRRLRIQRAMLIVI